MKKKKLLTACCMLAALIATSTALGDERDVVKALTDWNASLLPNDRHDKYCKMDESSFIFYRGSNHLFWSDFSHDERLRDFGSEKTRTWLQGDMHAENFGAYSNAGQEVVYGLNDFDDSVFNDYQYDLWRMATSLALVARQKDSIPRDAESGIVTAFAESYRTTVASYIDNDKESTTRFTSANTDEPLKTFLEKREQKKDASREKMLDKWAPKTANKDNRRYDDKDERYDLSKTLFDLLKKSTPETYDGRRFNLSLSVDQGIRDTVGIEKLAAVSASERESIIAAMESYKQTLQPGTNFRERHFAIKDIAKRLLAGTGSLGTSRYYVLIEGESKKNKDDRILDIKHQKTASALHSLSKQEQAEYKDKYPNPAEHHAIAYKALTNTKDTDGKILLADDHLGWMRLFDTDYSVRERSPSKKTFSMDELKSTGDLTRMAEQWGKVLATAHARAEPDSDEFEETVILLVQGHEAEFDKRVADIALDYAEQVRADWDAFKQKLAPTSETCVVP